MTISVLVPIDLRHESSWQTAIPEAIGWAQRKNAHLVVMTVVRDLAAMLEGAYVSFQLEHMVTEARRELNALVKRFDFGAIAVTTDVRFGSITSEILAAALANQADMIVMQSHRPEMLDRLIGPNAAHVALHAPCSVLVLRQPVAA
jgi:universal stress protein F